MGDQLQPNFLVVNPDGTLSAQLSGALQLPADVANIIPFGVPPLHAVRWTDSLKRTAAALGAWVDTARVPTEGTLALNAYSPDGNARASIQERGTATTADVAAFAQIGRQADGVQIIDAAGRSDLQRTFPGFSNLKMQTGQTNIAANAGGAQFYWFNLGQPWPSQHVMCMAWVGGAANYTGVLNHYGSQPSGLNQGAIVLNTNFAQTLTIGYISFGR